MCIRDRSTMSAARKTTTAELERSLADRAYRYSTPYASAGYGYGYAAPYAAAPYVAPAAPPAHVYHSNRVAEDLRAEEQYLEARRKLTEDLRKSEANEASAVDKRFNDERIAEVRLAEAHEQSRRAATAEAIAARATEELRLREAEAKAANAAAAEAKALCERAAEADRRATEARNAEVQAANEKARAAREAESVLAKSVADNESAAHALANVENVAVNTPLPGSYCSGPYQRTYAYSGPAAGPVAAYSAAAAPYGYSRYNY
eukprot:TRINITY_DN727_c0_g1_i3.p1 TRINITY_DN727_c0_g1~~TRINITY_DN727_c0_g1_i3.p1  ORF type:complete len:262 (+),score=85.88 TRINITY_DN727_c0_g1_i3:129-914(+)